MTTATIKLYKALVAAGVDEETARTVSEEVVIRDQAIDALNIKMNISLGLNIAMFAGVFLLLLEKLVG